ncbi:Cof-type HAD-IIB family hydrolase [Bacillus sp. SM2101]|uniref:Cof-type HAD-IIB family hydrolase n=1 Tax=Bacillus sp. SM2101 TaxID=2805366 RepID=UPI001BDEF537|nr:Cof-type HAD-IIB family hydrolase [Bacillus sp. SM2101]
MNPAVIALDLDGTLLNNEKHITNRNLQAVLNCYNNGKKIIIATARPPRTVKDFLPTVLREVSSFVYYNGALVVDHLSHFEEHISISKKITARVFDYCLDYDQNCSVSVEVRDKWFANEEICDASIFNVKYRPRILPFEQLKEFEATKLLLTGFNDAKKLQELFGEYVKLIVTDNGKLIQIMNKNVSKKTGILRLCNHFGVKQSDVIVFGDDYNDLDMFNMNGYGIAMANAVQELKEIADEVTDTNDNDGVAKILERMVR